MTSNPASRRARATSLAPRSCPSSPGLATSTRVGDAVTTPATSPNLEIGSSDRHKRLELANLERWGERSGERERWRAWPSEHDRLLELAPLVLEHVDHLADRAVRLGAVDEAGPQGLVVPRC